MGREEGVEAARKDREEEEAGAEACEVMGERRAGGRAGRAEEGAEEEEEAAPAVRRLRLPVCALLSLSPMALSRSLVSLALAARGPLAAAGEEEEGMRRERAEGLLAAATGGRDGFGAGSGAAVCGAGGSDADAEAEAEAGAGASGGSGSGVMLLAAGAVARSYTRLGFCGSVNLCGAASMERRGRPEGAR